MNLFSDMSGGGPMGGGSEPLSSARSTSGLTATYGAAGAQSEWLILGAVLLFVLLAGIVALKIK